MPQSKESSAAEGTQIRGKMRKREVRFEKEEKRMSVEKTDGRGLVSGIYIRTNREITREDWILEAFPEWGTFLNKEIEAMEVPKGSVSLWWCGGPSWVLKTDEGGIFLIDQWCGPSHYTTIDYCGVCKQNGAPSRNWLRLNPQVIDPFSFGRVDGVFCTHVHNDHCDIYTVKGTMGTTDAVYVAPPETVKRLKEFEVPDERIVTAKVGNSIKLPGAEVEFLMNYDDCATKTGDGDAQPYEDVACSFLFKTSAGNILFLGDTWYNDAYVAIGQKYDIDVAVFDIGYNAPGAFDKMTPYDGARLGKALKAKVLIPDHWENWANSSSDPDMLVRQFESISADICPECKTVIMRCAGRFDYPKDQDIRRYKYPDQSDRFRLDHSMYAKYQ